MHALSTRTVLATALLLASSIALGPFFGAAPAHAQWVWGKVGVTGGATLERMGDLRSTGVTASFESPTGYRLLDGGAGYHFGVTYDQPLGPVSVRPGFIARRAGTFRFPDSFEGRAHAQLEGRSFDVWVFEVPVDVRYQYDFGDVSSLYAFAGPMLSMPRAEEDFDRSFPNATIAAEGGIGGEFRIPDTPLALAPELRYSYSITSTVKKAFQLRGRSFDTEGLNLNGPSFRLHVYYALDF